MNDYSDGFGKRLRKLRTDKTAPMTQEKLAERLGVSPQAVSRWENGATLPDLPMIPAIANVFGVTTDYLLGVDVNGRDRQIKAIIDRAMERALRNEHTTNAQRVTALFRSIAVLREGLERYPGDFTLSLELMNALIECGVMKKYESADSNSSELREAEDIAEYIIEKGTDADIRIRAVISRVRIFGFQNRDTDVIAHIHELPPMYGCREALLCENLNDAERLKSAAADYFTAVVDTSLNTITRLVFASQPDGEFAFTQAEREKLIRKYISVFTAVYGEDRYALTRYYSLPFAYMRLYDMLIEAGDMKGAVEAATKAVDIVALPFEQPGERGEDSLLIANSSVMQHIPVAASEMARNLYVLFTIDDKHKKLLDDPDCGKAFAAQLERLKIQPVVNNDEADKGS